MHISIHALREEGDARPLAGIGGKHDFYPRPPRGGRPSYECLKLLAETFLSTPSARRATINVCNHRWLYEISIHALREEGDQRRRPANG